MRLRKSKVFKTACIYIIFSFLVNNFSALPLQASPLDLPGHQQFISLSASYSFPVLKGLKFDPANPLRMEFIVDTADKTEVSSEEISLLIKYFLAGLTTPEEDIWVNLSPYEQERIIPASLGQTDLGKDLLSQDYLLKQLTASLTYPESDTGKDYWSKTYAEVIKIAKTTNLPVNTFNKIWIMPDEAEVYEKGNTGLITKATLKAMLEEDYLALKNKTEDIKREKKNLDNGLIERINKASSEVMKQTVLPKITQEINLGKNFATLRQIYHSLVLGMWFKQKFQESIYKHYIDQQKIKGIDLEDKTVKEKIYQQYVQAFKSGLYNYIRTDTEPQTSRKIKRRYYSGGFVLRAKSGASPIRVRTELSPGVPQKTSFSGPTKIVTAAVTPNAGSAAQAGSPLFVGSSLYDTPPSVPPGPATPGTVRKYVYFFCGKEPKGVSLIPREERKALLGGKGAGMQEMSAMGIPVPSGFTITTAAGIHYLDKGSYPEGLEDEIKTNLLRLEELMGKKLGDPNDPLLVSVRSGAKFSMPGMMDTVLNLGLTSDAVKGLARKTDNPRFAYDAYRRFIEGFGKIVLGIEKADEKFLGIFNHIKQEEGIEASPKTDAELSAEALENKVIPRYMELIRKETGREFPVDPKTQLDLAIKAVFNSWNSQRAKDYREVHNISADLGTACSIVAMVFGNTGDNSGTGVYFTRDNTTGENKPYGDFLINAQGDDVVSGKYPTLKINELKDKFPDIYRQLIEIGEKLERADREMMDIEFTIEDGRLFILQKRAGKRTGPAAIRIAVDMAKEGLITKEEAILRISPLDLAQLLYPRLDPKAKVETIAKGAAGSLGVVTGKIVFDTQSVLEHKEKGEKVILVRIETSPEDFKGMVEADGILTARGGETSHAAIVCKSERQTGVFGAGDLVIDYKTKTIMIGDRILKEGDTITVDANSRNIYVGEVPLIPGGLTEEAKELLSWSDEFRRLGVRANADTPEQAEKAREFGAAGIGLLRIEHWIQVNEELQKLFQLWILSDDAKIKRNALDKIEHLLKKDMKGVLKIMQGYPVIVRTIDPPLHEFLPKDEDTIKALADALKISPKQIEEKIESLKESNPMLGHRGVRLGITDPEITRMQTKAIIEAGCALVKEGIKAIPEIMIPVVAVDKELEHQEKVVRQTANEVMEKYGVSKEELPWKFGTMIELPSAALSARELAKLADFLSFGTNDLTQTTLGLSRDDTAKLLDWYVAQGILAANPFVTLHPKVYELMAKTVREAKAVKGNLEIGICGEHGRDPESIEISDKIGLDYVSPSGDGILIARLVAAQSELRRRAERAKITTVTLQEAITTVTLQEAYDELVKIIAAHRQDKKVLIPGFVNFKQNFTFEPDKNKPDGLLIENILPILLREMMLEKDPLRDPSEQIIKVERLPDGRLQFKQVTPQSIFYETALPEEPAASSAIASEYEKDPLYQTALRDLTYLDENMRKMYGLSKSETEALHRTWVSLGFDGEANRLGWTMPMFEWLLDTPEGKNALGGVLNDAQAIREKFQYVIFAGMGGSGLGAQVVKTTFGEKDIHIYSLRSTDPSALKEIIEEILREEKDSVQNVLEKTLVIPVSKSGTTFETNSHKAFFEDLYDYIGFKPNIWIMTDKDSKMAQEARVKNYPLRMIQLNEKDDIGGRFSAPTTRIFLLSLALVVPEKVQGILQRAREMNKETEPQKDQFLKLGAFLYYLATQGKDKVTLIAPEELRDVPMWAEQLFEESLGKNGKGLSIFYGEKLNPEDIKSLPENNRVFLRINLKDKNQEKELWEYVKSKGYPIFEISLEGIDDTAGLMLGLQRTTAAIGSLWKINFVNQPAVDGYKKEFFKILSSLESGKKVEVPQEWKYAQFGSLKLYYQPLVEARHISEGEIKPKQDAAKVYASIIQAFQERKFGFEQAELAHYGKMPEELKRVLETARRNIFTHMLKIPAKLGEGPDKNHSYQQNVEDGRGFFSTYFLPLQFEQPPYVSYDDNPIKAQAIGTVKSVMSRKGPVVLITFEATAKEAAKDVEAFFQKVEEHLKPIKPAVSSSPAISSINLEDLSQRIIPAGKPLFLRANIDVVKKDAIKDAAKLEEIYPFLEKLALSYSAVVHGHNARPWDAEFEPEAKLLSENYRFVASLSNFAVVKWYAQRFAEGAERLEEIEDQNVKAHYKVVNFRNTSDIHIILLKPDATNEDIQNNNKIISVSKPGYLIFRENSRFDKREQAKEKSEQFQAAIDLLTLGVYTNKLYDFGISLDTATSHHSEVTNVAIGKHIPLLASYHVKSFLEETGRIRASLLAAHQKGEKITAVIAGAKKDKLELALESIGQIVFEGDWIVMEGPIVAAFLKLKDGPIGKMKVSDEDLKLAEKFLQKAKENKVNVFIPHNLLLVAKDLPSAQQTDILEITDGNIPEGYIIADTGEGDLGKIKELLQNSGAIVQSGMISPQDINPIFDGNSFLVKTMDEEERKGKAVISVGADTYKGDKLAGVEGAFPQYKEGGAFLSQLMSSEPLPGIAAIIESQEKFRFQIKSIFPKTSRPIAYSLEPKMAKDSRGKPTVEVNLKVGDLKVTGDVPAGASKGEDEARTVDVGQAIKNIREIILPLLQESGLDLRKHQDLIAMEKLLIEKAGENFKDLGANATVPVSRALWKMAAKLQGMELWEYIRKYEPEAAADNPNIVYPLMNIFNGGLHALKEGELLGKDRIDIQEIMIVPVGAKSQREALEMGDNIDFYLKQILLDNYYASQITRADEAGLSVKGLGSSDQAIEYVFKAIKKAGYEPGKDVKLSLDVAATSFFNKKEKDRYSFHGKGQTSEEMIAYYAQLAEKYSGMIFSIEDGLAENDWEGWQKLTQKMKEYGIRTIGDDLFVTQLERLNRGIESQAATDILIKVNQNGTMYGTLEVIKRAKAGMGWIVSHRSGETLDTSIADLAYATNALGLKTGDPQPDYDFGEGGPYHKQPLVRRVKYLRMIEIEEKYASSSLIGGATQEKASPPAYNSAPGGIDLEDTASRLRIKSDGVSSPVPRIETQRLPSVPVDFSAWPGLSFQIVKIEDIEDLKDIFPTNS